MLETQDIFNPSSIIYNPNRMVKKANLTVFSLLSLCIAVGIAYAIYKYIDASRIPTVNTIYVINLDRDSKRWESMSQQANALNLNIQRFPAIYGKSLHYEHMRFHGIGNALVRADRHDHKGERMNNLGIVGCYLSHRELLRLMGNMNVPDSYGHLILEYDLKLPSDFLQPGGRWDTLKTRIPSDWDIIWLGIWKPYGNDVSPGVIKLKADPRIRANLGTWAYMVKHGSIHNKILPWFEYMHDAWDEQMNLKFNEWNCYALVPGILDVDQDLASDSAINKINVAPEEKPAT